MSLKAERDEGEAVSDPGPGFTIDHSATPTLLQALDTMRRNKTFCDVVLHVGNEEIHCHRAVLASASPRLMEMFTSEKAPAQPCLSYKLNGLFERTALEKLIDYAYTARLDLRDLEEAQAVLVAAARLRMEPVVQECGRLLVSHLQPHSVLGVRSLPGIAAYPALLHALHSYIEQHFEEIRCSPALLALPVVQVEVLSQSREETFTAGPLCRLTLQWLQKLNADVDTLVDKTHMLYLALDNSLQDCIDLPAGDANDTDLVQDYKKLSKSLPHKTRKVHQVAKPRVLIDRDPTDGLAQDLPLEDCRVIVATQIAERAFLALATVRGKLVTLSVMTRHNPVAATTPSSQGSVDVSEPGSPPLYTGLANMGSVKCGAGCANLEDSLLVCGGYDRGECLRSVELYDPVGNTWRLLAPMLETRGRFNIAVSDDGDVYACGGSNGTTELATVERLRDGRWERVKSLPLARSQSGVCNLQGRIYCLGGWNGQRGMKQCHAFLPSSGEWTAVAPLQVGRYQAGTTSMDGKLWVVGGCDGWNCLTSVEIYDPVSDSWSFSKPMNHARRGCGVAVFKGKLYVVGGSDGSQSLNSTEIYDPVLDAWTQGPDTTTPRSNVGVAAIAGRLYAVGGFSGKTFLNSIEFLDEQTDEWTTFSPVENSTDFKLLEAVTNKFSSMSSQQEQSAQC